MSVTLLPDVTAFKAGMMERGRVGYRLENVRLGFMLLQGTLWSIKTVFSQAVDCLGGLYFRSIFGLIEGSL